MGTQRGKMKGANSWLVCWACRAGTRDFCSALAASSRPNTEFFFFTVHYFNSFVLSPRKIDRQPCWVACLLVFISGSDRLPCQTASSHLVKAAQLRASCDSSCCYCWHITKSREHHSFKLIDWSRATSDLLFLERRKKIEEDERTDKFAF
jgi:hypothetical protein